MARLARDGSRFAGCLGHSALPATGVEARKFHVLPDAGCTSARPFARVLGRMRADGCRTACLETAAFMSGTIRACEKAGFSPCPPFRPPPDGCDGMNVLFRRPLQIV